MKKLTLVFLGLFALLVQSCDQWPPGHGGGGSSNTTPDIVGKWQWVKSEGGIYYMVRTPATSGFEAVLSFGTDKTYQLSQSNNEGDFGSYTMGEFEKRLTVTLASASMRPVPFYSDALPVDENFVDFRGKDTLVLSGTGADMYTYTYVRLR